MPSPTPRRSHVAVTATLGLVASVGLSMTTAGPAAANQPVEQTVLIANSNAPTLTTWPVSEVDVTNYGDLPTSLALPTGGSAQYSVDFGIESHTPVFTYAISTPGSASEQAANAVTISLGALGSHSTTNSGPGTYYSNGGGFAVQLVMNNAPVGEIGFDTVLMTCPDSSTACEVAGASADPSARTATKSAQTARSDVFRSRPSAQLLRLDYVRGRLVTGTEARLSRPASTLPNRHSRISNRYRTITSVRVDGRRAGQVSRLRKMPESFSPTTSVRLSKALSKLATSSCAAGKRVVIEHAVQQLLVAGSDRYGIQVNKWTKLPHRFC